MPSRSAMIGAVAAAVLMFTHAARAADVDGDALYVERCAGCHGEKGALSILRQRSPDARERAYNGSHLRYHMHDEAERAAVIAHLKRMMRE